MFGTLKRASLGKFSFWKQRKQVSLTQSQLNAIIQSTTLCLIDTFGAITFSSFLVVGILLEAH